MKKLLCICSMMILMLSFVLITPTNVNGKVKVEEYQLWQFRTADETQHESIYENDRYLMIYPINGGPSLRNS